MPEYGLTDGLPDPTGPDLDPLDQEENSISADWARFSEILHPTDDDVQEIGWVSTEELTCKSCGETRSVVFFPHPKKSQICGRCTTSKKKVTAKDLAEAAAELNKKIIASIRSPRLDLDIKMPLLGEESRYRRWDLCDTGFVDRGHYVLVHPRKHLALVLTPASFNAQRVDSHEFPIKKERPTWPFGLGRTLQALGYGPVLQRGTFAHVNSYLPNDAFRYFVLGRTDS